MIIFPSFRTLLKTKLLLLPIMSSRPKTDAFIAIVEHTQIDKTMPLKNVSTRWSNNYSNVKSEETVRISKDVSTAHVLGSER